MGKITMEIIRETSNYSYLNDRLSGCGRFIRKSDNAITLWNTGTDHVAACLSYIILTDEEFDDVAANEEYFDGNNDEAD